ncbi:hypothetical protein PNA2_1419 [Pyrococcus sp. NA2]|uniref:DUF4129 domain-containing protein n=1 Tax=Pyrococcus sp. (strain NA2) TaxID=342949 RepID=UPI000209AF1C|nr:DUF4129 domain-containing protein [Pyrococcus sp. NA2]AEC52334.1 hypothetical protein PNA2_1419 [Pyrococcus sp. NA2]
MKVRTIVLLIAMIMILGLILRSTANVWYNNVKFVDIVVTMFIFGYIFIAIIFLLLALSTKDYLARPPEHGQLKNLLFLIISGIMLILYFMIIFNLPHLERANEITNLSQQNIPRNYIIVPPRILRNTSGLEFTLYIPIILFLMVLVILSLSASKRVVMISERRKIKKELKAFDSKLDEKGIDLFSNPREAVVELYKKAVLWLEILGIPYRESWTHWEHASKVTHKRSAYVELARLFEKAKYAPEKITVDDAKKAYNLYLVIRGED